MGGACLGLLASLVLLPDFKRRLDGSISGYDFAVTAAVHAASALLAGGIAWGLWP